MKRKQSVGALVAVLSLIAALQASGKGEATLRDITRYRRRQQRRKRLKKLLRLGR